MSDEDVLKSMPSVTNEEAWLEWYHGLSPEARKQISESAKSMPRVGPQPGPQTKAYNSKATVMGYGGAAGGGKTALMGLKVTQLHTASVVFRFDKTQLSGFIDDVINFWGDINGLNRQAGRYYFGDKEGHQLEWGGLGKPGSEKMWQGRAHDFIGFDEVTEIPLARVKFVMGWLRTHLRHQQTQVVMTFNPPGSTDPVSGMVSQGRWVIPYFAPWIDNNHPNPAEPGELRYFIKMPDGNDSVEVDGPEPREIDFGEGKIEMVHPQSRTFIPARVEDNKYMGEEYRQHLLGLDKNMRDRMYYGNFGDSIMDHPKQVIPTKWCEDAMARWTESDGAKISMDAIGVDVARGGTAKTVLVERRGVWFGVPHRYPGSATPSGREVMALSAKHVKDSAYINIDANGVGAAPLDFMREANMRVHAVQFAQRKDMRKLSTKLNMYNRRAWLFWLLRTILDPENQMNAALPPDDKLKEDLTAPTYTDDKMEVLIETKADIESRIGRSPDDGDALILSLYNFFDNAVSHRLKMIGQRAILDRLQSQNGNSWDKAMARPGDGGNNWMSN